MSLVGKDRRGGLRFDLTINITNIILILGLVASIIRFSNKIINYLVDTNTKISIMWVKFTHDNPELVNMYKFEDKR